MERAILNGCVAVTIAVVDVLAFDAGPEPVISPQNAAHVVSEGPDMHLMWYQMLYPSVLSSAVILSMSMFVDRAMSGICTGTNCPGA